MKKISILFGLCCLTVLFGDSAYSSSVAAPHTHQTIQSSHAAATIRESVPAYKGTPNDNKTCEAHYQTSAAYKALVNKITMAMRQEKLLRQKIKGILANKGHACPNQEYKIEVGEALLAKLEAGTQELQKILDKLMHEVPAKESVQR